MKLMTHVVVGYPDITSTIEIVIAMEQAGADYVELQIPFSDPIADGPTIMKACDIALKSGVTLKDCFKVMKRLSSQVSIPLFFMGYYNTVFSYGVEKFCHDAKSAGAYGLIIPDMPPDEEEHEHFIAASRKHRLAQIRVVTPASSNHRLKLNAQVADEFVYCVSHYGVTGSSVQLTKSLVPYINRVKKHFNLPVALGFGISTPAHIRSIKNIVDIAIVGSAIIHTIDSSSSNKSMLSNIKKLVRSLKI
ncbi:MAG: tryptophan synthase subunit alpha [bacterium]|nr:tryptophan synthase subunit alpha [bacterium]